MRDLVVAESGGLARLLVEHFDEKVLEDRVYFSTSSKWYVCLDNGHMVVVIALGRGDVINVIAQNQFSQKTYHRFPPSSST